MEEVAGYEHAEFHARQRIAVRAETERRIRRSDKTVERPVLVAYIDVVWIRERRAGPKRRRTRGCDVHHSIGLHHRKWLKKYSLGETEHGRRRADSDRHRTDSDRGEYRILAEHSEGPLQGCKHGLAFSLNSEIRRIRSCCSVEQAIVFCGLSS